MVGSFDLSTLTVNQKIHLIYPNINGYVFYANGIVGSKFICEGRYLASGRYETVSVFDKSTLALEKNLLIRYSHLGSVMLMPSGDVVGSSDGLTAYVVVGERNRQSIQIQSINLSLYTINKSLFIEQSVMESYVMMKMQASSGKLFVAYTS